MVNNLDPGIGFTTDDNLVINCLAYADDLILLATTRKGLLSQTRALERSLETGGLVLNVAKSATLEIKVDGKAKKWVACEAPFLTIGGKPVQAIGVDESYRYLGHPAGFKGFKVDLKETIMTSLMRLTKAPLKPQQRMFILRVHLIPRLLHRLVLGEVSRRMLECLDLKIRDSKMATTSYG